MPSYTQKWRTYRDVKHHPMCTRAENWTSVQFDSYAVNEPLQW